MSDSLPQVAAPPTSFKASEIRCAAPRSAADGGSLAYKLLVLFFIQLYSNLAVLYPALEVLRPALAIGGLALVSMVIERMAAGRGFRFLWPETFFLLAFIGAAGLSSPGAVWPGWAVQATTDLTKILIVYLLILNCVDSERRLRGLVWAMVLCGLFPALGALRFYHAGLLQDGRLGWVGIFGNPNELAYSLTILLPLAAAISADLGLLRRALIWALMGVYTLVIYLTFSRGGMLGLFAVLAFMGMRQRRASTRMLALGLMAAGLLAVSVYWTRDQGFTDLARDASFQQRITTFKTALAMFLDRPLLGVGVNCSMVAWPLYAPKALGYNTWLIVHNTFLQVLAETGLLGFVSFVAFLAFGLYRAWKLARAAARLGQERLAGLVRALEIAFWGFLVCGLSGGFVMSWFPYVLVALIGASARIIQPDQPAPARQPFKWQVLKNQTS